MSSNLAPIPERPAPPSQQSIGTFGPVNPPLGAGSGPRTSPIIRYLATLNRFKWLVLAAIVFGLGGGYLASRLMPESYVVTGSFYVATQTANGGSGGNNLLTSSSTQLSNDQWREFIRGYGIITPVVISKQLFVSGPIKVGGPPAPMGPSGDDAKIFAGLSPASNFQPGRYELKIGADGKEWELRNMKLATSERGKVGTDSIGKRFGFSWLPLVEPRWFGRSFEFELTTPREAAEAIRSDLKIDASPRARYIYLTLSGPNASLTAATLNDIMLEATRQALIQKKSSLVQQSETLDSLRRDSDIRLVASEQALSNYRTRTITLPRQTLQVAPGLASTTPQGYSEYTTRQTTLEALRRDRADLDTALVFLRNNLPVLDRFSTIPDVVAKTEFMAKVKEYSDRQSEYENLSLTLGPAYADSLGISMRQKRDAINKLRDSTIPFYARQVKTRMDERIRELSGEISTAATELAAIPGRETIEKALERDLSIAEEENRAVTQQASLARMLEKNTVADLLIQDQAIPPLRPTKNRRNVIIALGVLIGLGVGLSFAFLMDLLDKRVRYADQITSGLGLTILGVVPEVKGLKGGRSTVEDQAQVIEAFRTIRLNLAHVAQDGKLTLTISSPAPGEGKSLVASNLALSFAEAGYRVLLIDGDTRRGELHRNFGVDRRPGLIDHLADNAPLAPMLRATSHPLCTLLPSGSRKRNAPELLGSLKMRDLIQSFRDQFDIILVDSPPLGAGIDPFVLGTLTGNLMLVVRAGATQKDLAESKLQIVDQLPIRLVGAVLNDLQSSTHLYRYYSYSSGYASFDEGELSTGENDKPKLIEKKQG